MKQIGALLLIVSSMFLASCGSGGGGSSSSVDSSEMATTIRAGVSFYDNLISSGIGKDVAVNDTVSWFKTKSDVSDAYPAADNRNIFIEETNGITTLFITDTFSNTSSSSTKNLLNKKSNDMFHLSLLSSNNSIKAVVMDPCNVPISNSSDVNKVLTDCTYAVVDYLKGQNVTPEIIQTLSGNDLIYYIGHGGLDNKNGDIIWISTGVPFSKFNSYIAKYNDDPKKNNGKYKYFGRVATVFSVYLGVNSNFVRDFSKGLNATAVYVDACHSLDLDINDSMAQAFRNNGAKSYLGWGGLVFAWQGLADDVTDQVAVSFFKDILACKSVSTSFNNLPIDWNISDLHYRGDGKLPICDPITPLLPAVISVNPSSGNWTSTPQNIAVSSSNATAIYYTMVNNTDGNTPADPREPTSSDNDGSISVSGGAGTFQLYATAGQYIRSKLRFRGYNSAGGGPASGVYSYSINLSAPSPLPTLQTNAATATTLNGATLNGNVNPNGLSTTTWFEWGTNASLTAYTSTPAQSIGAGTTIVVVSAALTGLTTGSTYYYRVTAQSSAGTSRGSIVSLTPSGGSGGSGYLQNISAISAGWTHTVALKNDGTVRAWGDNRSGQLGDGTNTTRSTPGQVGGLSGIAAIAAGAYYTVALKNDGTVRAWGDNWQGQLGDGTTIDRSTPVQVSGLSGVTALAAGAYHTVALKNDGTVRAWGDNGQGQLGDGTYTSRPTPVQVSGLSGVTAIAAGEFYTFALKNDGTIWAWGANGSGQLGDGTYTSRPTPVQVSRLSEVTAMAAGSVHTVALKNDDAVWAWGYNGYGQLGDGTDTSRPTPVQVSGLSGVTAITAGWAHTVALKNDGTVWAWGYNHVGELGDGTTIDRSTPVQVSGLSWVTAIAAGESHTVALKNDGTVWAWGYNYDGRLGDGTAYTVRYTPVQVLAETP